jgi:hypothetical protein
LAIAVPRYRLMADGSGPPLEPLSASAGP